MSLPYGKIMVTLDGSAFAAQALPHAQALAERFDADLLLFQVVPALEQSRMEFLALDLAGVHETSERVRERALEQALNSLQAQADPLRAQGIRVQPVVVEGAPAETIIDYASENNVDLIVMSTHGRSGVERWVYGSVADKVLRGAFCPVLLVRLMIS